MIKFQIKELAKRLAKKGEMVMEDGRSLSKTITDLFDELREIEKGI